MSATAAGSRAAAAGSAVEAAAAAPSPLLHMLQAALTRRQLLYGDLKQVAAGTLVGESLQLVAPVHVLNFYFVVQGHTGGR